MYILWNRFYKRDNKNIRRRYKRHKRIFVIYYIKVREEGSNKIFIRFESRY